jgi:hypothetical protein
MSEMGLSSDVFAKMQIGEPFRTYKKTILGQVYINVLNPWDGKPEGMIMKGDPSRNEDGCFYDTWGEKDDMFFHRSNKPHFERGVLIPVKRPGKVTERTPNDFTDEELEKLVMSPFLKLQHAMEKMTSVIPVLRLLQVAEEKEKSEKIMGAIRARLTELQTLESQGKIEK